ncbi:hypothetical protein DFJ73DRAFT_655060 [Zopfochytrium polystomum]|nr:hypothetical protein DFJ73DRAFT_655060 [Zopfochytrium polystomum]
MSLHRAAVELGQSLNGIHRRRATDVAETSLGLAYTEMAFHHRCFEELAAMQPMMDALTDQLKETKARFVREPPIAAERVLLPSLDLYHPQSPRMSAVRKGNVQKEGYLFCKTSGWRETWVKQWWSLSGSTLTYTSEKKDKAFVDLRICMVRELRGDARSNCFELVNPSETFKLQALNEGDLRHWIDAIQTAISKAITSGGPPPASGNVDMDDGDGGGDGDAARAVPAAEERPPERVRRVREKAGNEVCADCGSTSDVTWAATNLGVVLCIDCGGLHRSLGSHISKVKSLTLDRWSPDGESIFLELGNAAVNELLEHHMASFNVAKPTAGSAAAEKDDFCRQKYVARRFLKLVDSSTTSCNVSFFFCSFSFQVPLRLVMNTKHPRNDVQNYKSLLIHSVEIGDAQSTLWALFNGADPNAATDAGGAPALHVAVAHRRLAIAELLLQWGASIDAVDPQTRRTALHAAVEAGADRAVSFLVRKGADHTIKDGRGGHARGADAEARERE